MTVTDRTVVIVLRLLAAIDLLAFGAAVMPFAWMKTIHGRLGLGTLPETPVVEYLARSASIWYAVHAVLILYLSTDVPRFRPAIRFLAWLTIVHGFLLFWSDVRAGMPAWWALAEFGGMAFEGVVVLGLLRLSQPNADHGSIARAEARG